MTPLPLKEVLTDTERSEVKSALKLHLQNLKRYQKFKKSKPCLARYQKVFDKGKNSQKLADRIEVTKGMLSDLK